jgi:tryptophan-rich sensory protein
LKQPPYNPPAWIFGPVWTGLYAAMGYAAHRAYHTGINSFDPQKVLLAKVRLDILYAPKPIKSQLHLEELQVVCFKRKV